MTISSMPFLLILEIAELSPPKNSDILRMVRPAGQNSWANSLDLPLDLPRVGIQWTWRFGIAYSIVTIP